MTKETAKLVTALPDGPETVEAFKTEQKVEATIPPPAPDRSTFQNFGLTNLSLRVPE